MILNEKSIRLNNGEVCILRSPVAEDAKNLLYLHFQKGFLKIQYRYRGYNKRRNNNKQYEQDNIL